MTKRGLFSHTRWATSLLFCVSVANFAVAGGDGEALQLGRQVQAAGAAILDPESAGAMQAITDLGTDSRYYAMVRGWLLEQIKGDRSIVAAAGPGGHPHLETRISFLEKAVRAIDLE